MVLEWVVMLRVSDQRCFVHPEDRVQTEPKLRGVPLRRNKIFHSLQKWGEVGPPSGSGVLLLEFPSQGRKYCRYWERYLQGSDLAFCAVGTPGLVPCHCTELVLGTYMPWLCLGKHYRSTPWGKVNLGFNSLLDSRGGFSHLGCKALNWSRAWPWSIPSQAHEGGTWGISHGFSHLSLPHFLDMVAVSNLAGVIPKVRSVSVQSCTRGSWQRFCFPTAETEKGSADHLDLAGLPPRPKEADSLQMTPPSPDSRKKARGIKKLFGR